MLSSPPASTRGRTPPTPGSRREIASVAHGGSPHRADAEGQGEAGRRVQPPLQGAPARRLLLLVLPGGQPPRRRGPDDADVPAGVQALRACTARVRRPAAAPVADPDRAQPRGELLPRSLAQAADADRRRRTAGDDAHDRAPGGEAPGPRADPRM